MFEKVNPCHPDKVADRIAGALVDYAYTQQENPKIAVEVLIGHGLCTVISETSVQIDHEFVKETVKRISKSDVAVLHREVPQDVYLSNNQADKIRCGDNGIFKGMPITYEQKLLSRIARGIFKDYPSDGKYILDMDKDRLIICQSNATKADLQQRFLKAEINPLGYWSGGIEVDSGATNRKLGSDMADSVTGGGLHGKDLSKADVSVNIYAWLKAQETNKPVELSCAIGDETIDNMPYSEVVEIARNFITSIGGFEKFAEWGLV